ncbi:MAG: hypothetical protein IOD03_09125 [Methylocystis sp.]|uniref:hypothetical protein n=1 Tax=Phenylobacterium sp. TaxID=1871053 RepID=UPI0025D49398|nr:hypothetical protein [Phenylobacterium sp.]MCA3467722.1 hypothetical protein [Rhodobacter sp.]MCA3583840.1 hypothetical protein [Methylocystis sp.]MCA3474441.1 hypothetical protein [Rhodobacter sp.]MCA3485475.1 hypothetical protein [Rhodobacter sp.]MCA3731526.1 hypothetical protein [Phenylobacterium sp.]
MTNLSASDLTTLTVLIDGQPRGRLATTAKTVERLRKTLAEVIGDAAATVIDRAMVCETFGGAEAILKAALKGKTADDPVPVETARMGAPDTAAPAQTSDAQRRRTKATAAMDAAKTGTLPVPPDFSAPTHARFRGKLEGLIALAERGDIEGLRDVTINPVSSSPKALARYRDLCVTALQARTEVTG